MPKVQRVTSDTVASPAILGTFEGECADSNITNLNGLDITRPVWESVFNSDDYKKGIELGHYIGFLGHPEDPNCMDFEHACIVMTEGHIDDDGKIQGKFNLVDTPVGRIVKTFQDAGVRFGISVRGAGDIIDNSVDPDTFVFRGFDLVAFPAYPDSIPTFTEVAASTDIESRKKYKAVCASVKENIDGLNTVESVEILQKNFAKQSDEYKALQNKKEELERCNCDQTIDIKSEQYEGLMQLYLDQLDENKKLKHQLDSCNKDLDSSMKACATASRKLDAVKRIYSAQIADVTNSLNDLQIENDKIKQNSCRTIASAVALQGRNKKLHERLKKHSTEISKLRSDNLKYKQEIDAARYDIRDLNSSISKLHTEIDETVRNISANEAKTSNLDAINKRLKSELSACRKLLAEYQDAYADIYANAVGVHLDNISVSESTSVSDIRSMISGSTSIQTVNYVSTDPTPVDVVEYDSEGLVTL